MKPVRLKRSEKQVKKLKTTIKTNGLFVKNKNRSISQQQKVPVGGRPAEKLLCY